MSDIKQDTKRSFNGKTVRNWYWKTRRTSDNDIIESRRKNETDLTEFDVMFNIVPTKLVKKNLSEADYASAIEYLDEHNIYKRSDRVCNVYHIPIIGEFISFDITTNIYNYLIKETDNFVEYTICNRHDSKYFTDKTSIYHRFRWEKIEKSKMSKKAGRQFNSYPNELFM